MGEYERSACTGKERFKSYHQADRVQRRRGRNRMFRKSRPYRCHSCHGWHLGAATLKRSEKELREYLARYEAGEAHG